MRIVAIALGAGCALLLLVVGLQVSELSTLRAEATDLRRQLSECRVAAARPGPRGARPAAAPAPADPLLGLGKPIDENDPEALDRMFDELGAVPPPPRPPPPARSPPQPGTPPPDMPDNVSEARQWFHEDLVTWGEESGASAAEVAVVGEAFDELFAEMEVLEERMANGDMDGAQAQMAIQDLRQDTIEGLRDEIGDEAFRDMWRSVHPGKLIQMPR